MEVVVVLLVAMIMIVLIIAGAIWGMNVSAARLVGDKHRLLQTIAETGRVPEAWRRPYEARIVRLRGKPGRAGRMAQLEEQARQHYLRELDQLVRYVRTTTLVENEQVRRLLLEKLSDARARWQDDRHADGV